MDQIFTWRELRTMVLKRDGPNLGIRPRVWRNECNNSDEMTIAKKRPTLIS